MPQALQQLQQPQDPPAPALRVLALPVQCLHEPLHPEHSPEVAPSAACPMALPPSSHPPAPGVSCLPFPMARGGTIREADGLGLEQGQGVLSILGKERATSLSSGARTAQRWGNVGGSGRAIEQLKDFLSDK